MSITQGLKRAIQVHRHGTATICGSRRRTWEETGQRVARLAGALRTLGLGREGRVAILSLNSDRFLETLYAVPWAGGIVVPVNVRLAPSEMVDILNDSGSGILIVDDAFQALLPAFHGRLDTVSTTIFAGDGPTPEGTVSYEEILAAAEPIADAERSGDDVAGIFYTGGTTGRSKGAMLTHGNIVSNAVNVILGLQMDERTLHLHAAPMFHLADLGATFGVTMRAGAHAFLPKFDPAGALQAIAETRATMTVLVPTMIGLIVHRPDVSEHDLTSLRTIAYGGAPMPEALLLRAIEVLPDCRFIQAYGMTELSPVATFLEPGYHTLEGPLAGRLASAGRAVSNVEVRIVDAEDREVPPGTIGEIVARGPTVMKGYWNQPETTALALRGGFMHTGDAGYMDEGGFLYVVDRLKDMVITGGENVYTIEVENAIYQHPAVAMCAVIGIPSDAWGETLHAVVVPKPGQELSEDAIVAHCRERIAGYKCPRSVEICAEPLPLSGAGKVLKTELRRPFWQGRERQVS